MSKTLIFATIASIIAINSVFADTQTITTQDYVDLQVATKQDKISAKTEEYYPDSVLTDTPTNGNINKRLVIYGDPYNAWFIAEEAIGDAIRQGRLITAMQNWTQGIYNYADADLKNAVVSAGVLNNAFNTTNSMILDRQKNKTCVRYLDGAAETSENCLLWNLPD